jgi:hypothetical protein
MHRIASLAAKLALMTAVGAGSYLNSLYSDGRMVSNWTTWIATASPQANHQHQPARGTNSSRQLLTTEPSACDRQTWPNISPECISGRVEPAKVVERPAIVPEQPSSILLRPTRLPGAVPDPEITGSLPLGEQQFKVRDGEPAVGTIKTSRKRKPSQRERSVIAKAKRPQAEHRARAEERSERDAGGRNRSSPIIAVADRAPESAPRVSEPIHFRLAEGHR